jgi:hypothetical protein
MMKEADTNNDKKLSKAEFYEMMLKYYNSYPVLSKWKLYWKTIAFADVYTWCQCNKAFFLCHSELVRME